MILISTIFADNNINRHSNANTVKQFVRLFPWLNGDPNVAFCACGITFAGCNSYAKVKPTITLSSNDPVLTLKTIIPDIRQQYFSPSPAVEEMRQAAMHRQANQLGHWIEVGQKAPKRGWLVVYHWKNKKTGERPNHGQHIGIVLTDATREFTRLDTVEYNTTKNGTHGGDPSNGGYVQKKTGEFARFRADVMGFIATN